MGSTKHVDGWRARIVDTKSNSSRVMVLTGPLTSEHTARTHIVVSENKRL